MVVEMMLPPSPFPTPGSASLLDAVQGSWCSDSDWTHRSLLPQVQQAPQPAAAAAAVLAPGGPPFALAPLLLLAAPLPAPALAQALQLPHQLALVLVEALQQLVRQLVQVRIVARSCC